MVDFASQFEGLALIVAAFSGLGAENEINLKIWMPLSNDVHQPSLNAATVEAANGVKDADGITVSIHF